MGRGKPSCQGPRAGADPFQEPTRPVWLEPKARELGVVGQAGGPTFQGPVCLDKGAMVELGVRSRDECRFEFQSSIPGYSLGSQVDVGMAGRALCSVPWVKVGQGRVEEMHHESGLQENTALQRRLRHPQVFQSSLLPLFCMYLICSFPRSVKNLPL